MKTALLDKSREVLVPIGKSHLKLKLPSPALMAAIAAITIMCCALLLSPIIGMADNGDFYRVANGQGIYKLDRNEDDQYLNYASSKFGIYKYYNEYEKSLLSTQIPLIKLAKALNIMVIGNEVFDIRFMSALLILYCAVAIYLLVDFATYYVKGVAGYLVAALCVFMFADTGYTAYFNSFYAEGLAYVSFLCTIGCALLITQKRYSPYALLAFAFFNGIVLTGTKQQNAPVGILLAILFVILAFTLRNKLNADKTKQYIKNIKKFIAVAFGSAIILTVSGIAVYLLIPQDFVNINQYHAMTRGILMTSENPEQALEEFGINKQYALLNNSIYYERYPAIDVDNQMLSDSFYNKYNFVSVTAYYIRHPQRLLQMLDIACMKAYTIRPESIGNFEKSTGAAAGEKTSFFTLYSTIKQVIAPKTLGFMLIWFTLAVILSRKDKGKCWVIALTILIGFSQIGVSIIGAGDADISKHIFLYNVAFDLVNFIGGASLIVILTSWVNKKWNNRKNKTIKKIKPVLSYEKGELVDIKKITATMLSVVTIILLFTVPAHAQNGVLLVYKTDDELSTLSSLISSCGMPVKAVNDTEYKQGLAKEYSYMVTSSTKPLLDADYSVLCVGNSFESNSEVTFEKAGKSSISIMYEGYSQPSKFENDLTYISKYDGQAFAKLKLSMDRTYPFAVINKNRIYAPYYHKDDLSEIALGALMQKYFGINKEGTMYVMIDEIYPFSNLDMLCSTADSLYKNAIPFLVSIVPEYDNLDYPAFLRFMQALRYVQARNGSIVLHDPIVKEQEIEREPLADKMERFYKALDENDIKWIAMNPKPYPLKLTTVENITTNTKNFGNLPFDTTIVTALPKTNDEINDLVLRLNQKWLTIGDYKRKFTYENYQYGEADIDSEHAYYQEEQQSMVEFFFTANKFLIIIVGVVLVLFSVLIIIGSRLYKKKFY